ncbi:41303_t:CDS:2, partial [Gigaspora margarita]
NDEIADDSDHDQFYNSAWIPTERMLDLSTRIHKENLLSQASRLEILRNQPQNAEIKYEAPIMDKQIWKLMPTHAKDTDKLLAEQSLKVILSNYTPPMDKDEVFGDKLGLIIKKEFLPISSLTKRQIVAKDIIIEVVVVNPLTLKVISVSAECEGAITGHTIDHKTRETSFGVVTVMEVAQEHTTIKPMHQTKERYNTSGNKFNASSYSMVTTDRFIMAYLHNQTLKKTGYKRTRPTYSLFSIKNIFYFQKGWISKVDHRPKETKYLHMSHALQNGETIEIVKSLIKRNDYMTTIDIQNAFYHVPLSPSVSQYFAFDIGNYRYQFTALLLFRIRVDKTNKDVASTLRELRVQDNEPKPSKAKSQQPKEGMYRNLEKIFTAYKRISHALRNQGWNSHQILSSQSINQLNWWIFNLKVWNGTCIIPPEPTTTIYTNASLTEMQKELHINMLELKAIYYALLTFRDIKHQTILIKADNCIAIQNQSNSTIPTGELNTQADLASRHKFEQQDWQLNPKIFEKLVSRWGPFTIDLFANQTNTQLPDYYSRFPDSRALATDALNSSIQDDYGPSDPLFNNTGMNNVPIVLSTNEDPNRLFYTTSNT